MQTFFVNPPVDGRCILSCEDARHALKSLRMRSGDSVSIAYGGRRYEAVLLVEGQDVFALPVTELAGAEPRLKVTLYQGLPKGDKMEGIVQKCTELGAHAIVPCLFERCIARWEGGDNKRKRWQRIAAEAATQSGRSLIPQVEDCLDFQALRRRLALHELALVPWEEERTRSLSQAPLALDIAVVIGPEGGISPGEIEALGALPLTLGPRILRTETAGMAALAALMALRGEMG